MDGLFSTKSLYQSIKDKLIDNKVSSYTTTILNDRIENAEIKIYDPLFESKFESSYEDYYELISKHKKPVFPPTFCYVISHIFIYRGLNVIS